MFSSYQILEQKIYSLQEELTNLHRRKGEHAQQIVDLTSKLQETEKNLSTKESMYVIILKAIATSMFILLIYEFTG